MNAKQRASGSMNPEYAAFLKRQQYWRETGREISGVEL
jgi:hypothetical protein